VDPEHAIDATFPERCGIVGDFGKWLKAHLESCSRTTGYAQVVAGSNTRQPIEQRSGCG
jgi:hypothetical protein